MNTKTKDEEVYVDVHAVRRLITEVFVRAGCNADEAKTIAHRLSGANLRGHDSHGIIRVPRYVEWIEQGRTVPNQTVTVETENDVIAVIDGKFGFGQTVGQQAVDIGVKKALANGVGVTALKHAGHLGRIGDWAERAAESNCASIHMVNVRGSLLVAPFGGAERRGSTSPFCCGIPMPDGPAIILDFATSLVAEGKALVAARGGKPLPSGALITGEGDLTADPMALYGQIEPGRSPDATGGSGALTGFGLHKGSGLNFFMEMFAGALTGSGTSGALGETDRRRFCNGMLSIFLSVDFFHSDDWFATEVRNF
ncbi:MAG: Ldh family oxidoreductase, partial [Gammaproteobacteria bacterium]|nr:Ldh family oxidoreductase [Gammaproteobacteria bacterium]